ncbi:MAG: hypothetical protein KA479_05855 [Saprospiraceae bacterium]|nr:hypothetical protein [Saprospiraceae bacterium]
MKHLMFLKTAGSAFLLPAASIFILLLSGCNEEPSLSRPDVSHLSIDTEIRRFERDLFALDSQAILQGRAVLDSQYGEFAKIYFGRLLSIDNPITVPEGPEAYLKGFLFHPSIMHLYDTVQLVFPNLNAEKKQFDLAFKYLQYYFPERPTPSITTFISEYSVGNFIYGQDELAVGLDLYLGKDYPYANIDPSNPMFSTYLTRTYNRDHLVSRTLKPLLEDIAGPVQGERMIDHIIRNGKVLYLMELLLPEVPDTARLEFTPEQVTWCVENERNIWSYFLSENLLYSTDWKTYRKFIEYSPNSPGMPEEAPGRTGDFIGLQIIYAWFKKHPDATPADLMRIIETQQILDGSMYKPRR